MHIVHYGIEQLIKLDSRYMNTVIFETPENYSKYVSEFLAQCNGTDGNFKLFDGINEHRLSKSAYIIYNVFENTTSDRRITSAIYKAFDKLVTDENRYTDYLNYIEISDEYINTLITEAPFNVEIGEQPLPSAVLKAFNVAPKSDYSSLLEKLVDTIGLVANLFIADIVIFFGIKTVLTSPELNKLIKFASQNGISLLDFEAFDNGTRIENEKILIIDKDFCEILINY
ncbi:MAG: type II-A CRISPR-associated protein Csn2 [Christensenellales bacterium]